MLNFPPLADWYFGHRVKYFAKDLYRVMPWDPPTHTYAHTFGLGPIQVQWLVTEELEQ